MIDAEEEVERIRQEWGLCTRCPLHESRGERYVVIGAGPVKAKYMLIYDVPNKEDTHFGEPLMNALDNTYLEIFEAGGLSRDDMFITPLVGCSPLYSVVETQTSKATTVVRPPKAPEIAACRKRITDLIYAVDPRLIFVAGLLSWKELVPGTLRLQDTTLHRAAGKIYTAVVPGRRQPISYPVVALLGPNDVMKNPSPAPHGPIGITAQAVENAVRYVKYVEKLNGSQKDR